MKVSLELTRTKVKSITEQFKGFFDTGWGAKQSPKKFNPGQFDRWRQNCLHFTTLIQEQPLAKQAMLTVAGQTMAEGMFLQAVTDSQGKEYPRSVEALQAIEDLNDRIKIETKLYNTAFLMGTYGSCFWESSWTPKFDVRQVPMQEHLEPDSQDLEGNITGWRYGQQAGRSARWSKDEITVFNWNPTSQSWPYGTSLLTGTEVQFDTLEDLKVNANAYMEKQAYPYEAVQVGDGQFMPTEDDLKTLKSKWKNRRIGENIITTYETKMMQGGTGGQPIRELNGLLEFIKDDLTDGMMLPPISKLYNSTEASAKVMSSWAASNLVKPMQRIIRDVLVENMYKPYLQDLGMSVKICPKVLFESPDAHKIEDGQFWVSLVNAQIATPQQAAEELGIEYDEAYFEKKKQEEIQQQQLKMKQSNSQNNSQPKEAVKNE